MKYSDLMIDIETLATSANAYVLSIGAVAFNKDTHEIDAGVHFALAPNEQRRAVSFSTVKWWLAQGKAAQEAAFAGSTPTTLALRQLGAYIGQNCTSKCRVWANGPQFDLVILRSLCDDFNFQPPWHYRQERDFRTFTEGRDVTLAVPRVGEAHNALDDAIWQAKAVQYVSGPQQTS